MAELSHDEVVGILGRLSDIIIAEIIATGITKDELYQPADWATLEGFPNRRWRDSRWQTEGCLPWAKRCRLGRTIRPVRFGGLRSARRMRRKREGFWQLRRCSTGFRVKKRRSSAGWIARRCVTG